MSAQAVIHAATDPLPFTGLHRLEMRNALVLGVFWRVLSPAQVSAAWSDVERDLRSGRLFPQPVNWTPVYRAAAQWAASHSPAIGCRSLDVLHVALAEKLGVLCALDVQCSIHPLQFGRFVTMNHDNELEQV